MKISYYKQKEKQYQDFLRARAVSHELSNSVSGEAHKGGADQEVLPFPGVV